MIFFFVWGCTPEPLPEPVVIDERPDIVLITIDTLRADRLGAYGDQHAKTPNLDQLAREGILFAESHAVTPLTLPSHASILTGLLPQHHQVRDNAGFVLADEYTTIAEALQASGYATGAFISAYVLSHSWGVAQGFDTYHDPFHPQDLLAVAAFGEAQLPGNEVLNVAKKWWKDQELTNADKPRFAWVHLYDPHTPWEPGDSWEGDPYRGEIAKVDHWLGDLFDLTDDAWVIVTSDHGESLWEHGEREHGVLLHRSVTRVPLIIRPPEGLSGEETLQAATWLGESLRPDGVDDELNLTEVSGQLRAAKIVRGPVSGIDLAPTIAGLADVSLPSDGRDLLQPLVSTPVYAETYFPYFHYGWHPLSMVQDETQRLEQGAEVKAISMVDQQPMSPASALLDAVQSMRGAHPSQLHQPISAEQEAALAALGYQSSFVFPDVTETADPREKMELLMALHEAEQQLPEQGIPILRNLVASEPMLLDARLSLSYLLSAQGDFEAALQECIEVLHVNPNHSVALNNSVILSHKLKQFDLAIQFANTMMQSNPRDVRPHRYLTAIYAEQDRPQDVIRVAGSGLQIEPNDPNLNYLKGLAHVLDQSFDQAIPHLNLADQNGSRANDIHLWMGIAAEELGRIDEAVGYYESASSDMPVDPRPYARAGLMLAEADRCPEAKKYLVNLAKRLGGVDPTLQDVMTKCGIR